MGDLIDGKQRRSEGTTLYTTSLGEQVDMARTCFRAIPARKRPKRIVRVSGTSYHESFDGPLEAFDLEFDVWQPREPEQQYVLDIQLPDGQGLNIKHTPEGSAALYMGTVQDRELLWAKVIEACNDLPPATFLVRGHLHFSGEHHGYGKRILNCPCWCLQQPYALNRRYYRWQPSIGGLTLTRLPKSLQHMNQGWVSHFETYQVPPLEQHHYAEIT